MKKLINKFVGDERVQKEYAKAGIITLFITWAYMIIRMILVSLEVIEINFVTHDFYFLLLSFIVFTILALRKESDDLIYSPIARKNLPYKKGRFGGRLPIYILEAAAGAIFLTLIRILVEPIFTSDFDFTLLNIVSTFISFTIILIFVYIISGETRVRKFRKDQEEDYL